jgi:transposase-like protein
VREAESGETVVEVCRKYGISQQSYQNLAISERVSTGLWPRRTNVTFTVSIIALPSVRL